ncbi:hypothetical protein BGX38DRAFT_1192512 [Terfezia claveryi]|nr:hypothetical protein BGX38DRAFT_1192512 [Terfezia claveryi]
MHTSTYLPIPSHCLLTSLPSADTGILPQPTPLLIKPPTASWTPSQFKQLYSL